MNFKELIRTNNATNVSVTRLVSSGLIGCNILTFPQFTKLQRCGRWDAIFEGNRSANKNKKSCRLSNASHSSYIGLNQICSSTDYNQSSWFYCMKALTTLNMMTAARINKKAMTDYRLLWLFWHEVEAHYFVNAVARTHIQSHHTQMHCEETDDYLQWNWFPHLNNH